MNLTNKEANIPLKIWQTYATKNLPPKINECVNILKQQLLHLRLE